MLRFFIALKNKTKAFLKDFAAWLRWVKEGRYLISEVSALHTYATSAHDYATSAHATTTREISHLHDLVTRRLIGQVQYLNQQVHSLKHHLYHAGAAEPTKAFNGQFSKHQIFADLCAIFPFDAFVETGTYQGETTRFLTRHGKPVYSVEINAEYFFRSKEFLKTEALVQLTFGDSPEFLRDLTFAVLKPDDLAFVYLDAHWYDHLPLREEFTLIFTHHPRAVVMIDDFKIDDDDGYGYDSYDNGQEVSLAFLDKELRAQNWQVFFPSMPSAHDHITIDILPPRGTGVVACDPDIIINLKRVASLRHWPLA